MADQQLEEDDAEGVNVCGRGESGGIVKLLGSHVLRRAHHLAKTGQLGHAIFGHQDVGRLEVAVDHPALVQIGKAVGDLDGDIQGDRWVLGPALADPGAQVAAVGILEEQVWPFVVRLNEIGGNNVFVGTEFDPGQTLVDQAVESSLRGASLGQQRLDGHIQVPVAVVSEIDDAHAASGRALDLVAVVDDLAGLPRERFGSICPGGDTVSILPRTAWIAVGNRSYRRSVGNRLLAAERDQLAGTHLPPVVGADHVGRGYLVERAALGAPDLSTRVPLLDPVGCLAGIAMKPNSHETLCRYRICPKRDRMIALLFPSSGSYANRGLPADPSPGREQGLNPDAHPAVRPSDHGALETFSIRIPLSLSVVGELSLSPMASTRTRSLYL